MLEMPLLTTERLIIRPFVEQDLDRYYEINVAVGWAELGPTARQQFEEWLAWSVRNYVQLARLYQPPYGDRAVVLRDSGWLIGAVGLVPYVAPFGLLPAFGGRPDALAQAEVGLFWILDPTYQGQGYATEAAAAVVHYAFSTLRLQRLVATTGPENMASMKVMTRLGMTVERNPKPEPPWLQVVGLLENPGH
jgi:RimJ/RimL family protein N-acetyltransferase